MFFYQNVLGLEEPNYLKFRGQRELEAIWNAIPGEPFPITRRDGVEVGKCKDVGNNVCVIFSAFDNGYFLETGGRLDEMRSVGYTIGAASKAAFVQKASEAAG
jgi:hypothetical protein